MPKIGNYHYSDGNIARLTFGIDRAITIVQYDAFEAMGLIGSEVNGIAVLDDDNVSVVIDRHMIAARKSAQIEEFERIKAMPWSQLSLFLRTHPRLFPGTADDLLTGREPARGDLINQARTHRDVTFAPAADIRTQAMLDENAKPDRAYAWPASGRSEVISFLCKHGSHSTNGAFGYALGWDIKATDFDGTGTTHEFTPDPAFSTLWKALIEKDEHLFWDICAEAVSPYVDGQAQSWPGDDEGDWSFRTEGRSGGWLVLSKWRDHRMEFSSAQGLRSFLDDLPDAELVDLYKGIVCFDSDLANPADTVAWGYSQRRANREEAWKEDPASALTLAVQYGLPKDELAGIAKATNMTADQIVSVLDDVQIDEDAVLDIVEVFGGETERERVSELIAERGYRYAPAF
ncbi:hypothetical protein [Bosea sp. ANAM02]|uniref:hypothetical protein n=1 Tax=Bosea sp. ANAM02 TaxID=2020412 RepID=UPI001566E9C5|nr:hypothetical protein [Bosea sp. ANAM02]